LIGYTEVRSMQLSNCQAIDLRENILDARRLEQVVVKAASVCLVHVRLLAIAAAAVELARQDTRANRACRYVLKFF
jgi:hypothetical protein